MSNHRYRFASTATLSLTVAAMLCVGAPARAQSTSPNDNRGVDNRSFQNDDGRRSQLAQFDQFLDSHPEIAEQVRKNPSLADDRTFVQNHPALQSFLQNNPDIRNQLRPDPNVFMRQEDRFDRREDSVNRDAQRRDVADFDRFLDSHRDIAEQVRRNPSLVDNREFVQNHPALQSYLQNNPDVRDQIRQDPNAFMRQEDRFDRREDSVNRDAQRRDVADFDRFLDSHREIAEQVRRNPSLVDNREFVQNHPALQSYLQNNPDVRDQIRQNPNAFMRDENRFDHIDDGRTRDSSRDHMASFGEFLGTHESIKQDVSKDPTLVKNREYVDNHGDLNDYLNAHPDVKQDWMANPHDFVKGAQQLTNGSSTPAVTTPGTSSPNRPTANGTSSSSGATGTAPNPAPAQNPNKPKQ